MPRLTVGIDIGGTFTDVVAYDSESPNLWATKVPSTPANPLEGMMSGIKKVLRIIGASTRDMQRLVHGTTIATNAIVQHGGATIGLLTTAGFEDVLNIGTMYRSKMYDLFIDSETPAFLCPRRRIFGIPERLDPEGNVVVPLDEQKVRESVKTLVEKYNVQVIAICYLFSFVNPRHEIRTKEIINELYPDIEVSASAEVDPKFREFERLCVTTFDAYVKPVIVDYTRNMTRELKHLGIDVVVQIMQSRGGIASVDSIVESPVTTILSGPAAGVMGGKHAGQLAGFESLITVDIGGTSCDIALVQQGKPMISTKGRFEKYPFRLPMVDVKTIGAGGGSIAWLDEAGGLRVGPHSAGASPGPACYATGGDQPTVTDASLVLGYLNPDYFAAGELNLKVELAKRAIEERIAGPLSMDLVTAAAGIHRILNSNMAQAMRLISIERGYDPRDFVLVALGGAGPVHCGRLAEELSIPRMVVPATPGCLSALGLLMSDIEHEFSKTHRVRADEAKPEELGAVFEELDRTCKERMRMDRVPEAEVVVSRFAEMRYVGQSFELEVPFPDKRIDRDSISRVVELFHEKHQRTYGHRREDPVEFVTLRAVHTHHVPKPVLSVQLGSATAPREARKGVRKAYFDECKGYAETPVFAREKLFIGQEIEGPAIIEQEDTTTVVYPGQKCRVDESGSLIISTRKYLEGAGRKHATEATVEEREIDPITMEVLRNRFDVIADEMQIAMLRSAYSPIVKEGGDASTAIFDRKGRLLAQANSLPAHLGFMLPVVKKVLETYPPNEMKPGDVYIMNEPYEGGSHVPDLFVVSPVLFKGEVAALSCTVAHHQDMGGMAPGSCPIDAREIYAEGLRIPLMKFYDQGVPNDTLIEILKRNVRIPEIVLGDLGGQLAAAHVGAERLKELLEEYGPETIYRAVERLMDHSERLTRLKLSEIPDGTYSFYDFLDDDGIDLHKPVKVNVTVTVKGSNIYFDLEGSTPQLRSPLNSTPSSTLACIYYLVRAITDPTIPNNEGCFRPINYNLPRGSIFNPNPPAPVGVRIIALQALLDALFGALAQAIPHKIPAAPSSRSIIKYVGGIDPKSGKNFVTLIALPTTGAMGARPTKDGLDVICCDLVNRPRYPFEAAEMDFPMRILKCSLWQDSGGAGKFRGGLGFEGVCQWLRGEVTLTHRGDRHDLSPWGLFGGKASPRSRTIIMRREGNVEELPSKKNTYLREGDILHIFTTGGGGYGDPLERNIEKVLEDVHDGKVSLRTARDVYGVVIDTLMMKVDERATLELRQHIKQSREKKSEIVDRGPGFHGGAVHDPPNLQ